MDASHTHGHRDRIRCLHTASPILEHSGRV